ncbi:hypothetical protein Salat_1160200 [Sesamum alatum]|uniref:Uncharacterized protein n=1 Tax=Sesamum alatum TaxID=300844 RepID=A0AAE1YE88_9LAMI|nr:hypothetical protein Salat_1160200 [Sesamum alatum]
MEKHQCSKTSTNSGAKEEIVSCWGRFMMLMPLGKRSKKAHRKLENSNNYTSKLKRRAQPSASFRYSPQSYSTTSMKVIVNGKMTAKTRRWEVFRRGMLHLIHLMSLINDHKCSLIRLDVMDSHMHGKSYPKFQQRLFDSKSVRIQFF